jgi:LmbE family N-acetylglucosaminyl deacetylase
VRYPDNEYGALLVSPHPDDAELGCAYLLGSSSTVLCLSAATTGRAAEAVLGAKAAGCDLIQRHLEDGRLGEDMPLLIAAIEWGIEQTRARIVAGPPLLDEHQDHRAVAHAIRSATRRSALTVVEYETPSTPPEWAPDTIVPLAEESLTRQLDAVAEHTSQAGHPYVEPGALRARSERWAHRIGHARAEAYRTVRRATL